jgi:transcription elongation factor GreA
MHDELTAVDIQKMKDEIAYRRTVLRPRLIADVQTARSFGDLSENFEYKCAKRDKNRNDSRIRYLENMIRTATVIDAGTGRADVAELFDQIEIYHEKLDRTQVIRVVTTLRQNALQGLISKESPVGKAILGHRAGDRVEVVVDSQTKFTIVIRSIVKGTDDASLDISSY